MSPDTAKCSRGAKHPPWRTTSYVCVHVHTHIYTRVRKRAPFCWWFWMSRPALWPESASCYLLAIRARQLSNCRAPLSGGRGESGHPGWKVISFFSWVRKGACERLEACKCCSGRRPLVEGQGRRTKPAPSCHMGRLCKEEAESQFNTSSVVCIESPAQRFLPRADHAALCQVVSWALGQTRPLCCHSPCGAPGTNHESQHSAMKGSRAVL